MKNLSNNFPNFLLVVTLICSIFFVTGCDKGDLRFKPSSLEDKYKIAGRIILPEVVETDLLKSSILANKNILLDLQVLNDFSIFTIECGGISTKCNKDGTFTLTDVKFDENLLLKAKAGKVELLLRIFPRTLLYKDTTNLTININTTAIGLVWQKAKYEQKKEITEWDILAREYTTDIASLAQAIKLSLQLSPSSVKTTILDLPAISNLASTIARKILVREQPIREAILALENALYKKNLELFKYYISPNFTNDWDSNSTYADFVSNLNQYFKTYNITQANFEISDMEFLPNELARVRTKGEIISKHYLTEIEYKTNIYTSDVYWRKEGNLWKIYKNLPYKSGHPSQVNADSRWGEISSAHSLLFKSLFLEDIKVFENLISSNFRNDWDITSNYNDIISTTRQRFNNYDVKNASYTIKHIDFINENTAKVYCTAQLTAIRLLPGVDVNTPIINAVVEWRKEDGVWRIFRNLPYKFSHPLNIVR